jgi:putative FmdB family regulatory protein
LYEYQCEHCRTRFERLSFDRDAEVACRECGSRDVTRLLSTFAVVGEKAKPGPPAGACAGCEGMQDGSCPMRPR